jgi:GT2 family glycosyltransferase/predicted Zn-dependent protease
VARRYLFGPVTPEFAEQNLANERRAGRCLAFGAVAGLDLAVGDDATWQSACAAIGEGGMPDFLILYLPYTTIPERLWSAPVPIIGLAADWNLLWHQYRWQLPNCDLVLTDVAGVEALRKEGMNNLRAANLYGAERRFLEDPSESVKRDIDVLFVGNLHPAVQRERLAWLGRIAALSDRCRVEIHTGVFGDEYVKLLRRASIVFNRSIRGECNKRVFEAMACGALLFQEEGNLEVPSYFEDGKEYVSYTAENLEQRLKYYLEHDDERERIAEAGRERARRCGFDELWGEALRLIDEEFPRLMAAAQERGESRGPRKHFLSLLRAYHPDLPTVRFDRVEELVRAGRTAEAVEEARQALVQLDAMATAPRLLGAASVPTAAAYDFFRVEEERAGWANAGNPLSEDAAKRTLLRWRLQERIGEMTADLVATYEAVVARPDMPTTRKLLAQGLLLRQRPLEAVAHLRFALADNPFDTDAAALLSTALDAAGAGLDRRRLARERRRLCAAAPAVVPAESWFMDAPPVGDELASIIIPCCNQLDFTKLCLESVLANTRAPYELIIVDNASTDGTREYLEEFQLRPGPKRTVVIHNEENRGFPASCNQGLAVAQGDYLVLLNNDTVVTEGWLDGLIAWSLNDWPSVGLVGAMSNYAPPPQLLAPGYADLAGLPAFAAKRARQFAAKAMTLDRLTGFCLLVRRDVLKKIGGFDESFGNGFFDDDDLCIRAREAGFRLFLALNVYIHHFGSQTFKGLGIDCEAQLKNNFERFKAKWGEERAAGYKLPDQKPGFAEQNIEPCAVVNVPAGDRPQVSLCMIVKNEEDNLADCLQSVADLVGEIVVVDTGSTDTTKEIAARFGAKVFDFPWVDSFATARNECLRHAKGEWIFWMDADDRLDGDNRERLRRLFATLGNENVAYDMKCLCLPDPVTHAGTIVDHIRLFRHHPQIRWEHRVHEQILPAVRRLGGDVKWSDVVINHVGYQDPALRRRKLDRDLRLLRLELTELPDHPFTLFNLASVYQELGQVAEAIPLLRRSLETSAASDSIVRKLYAMLAQCHRHLGQSKEAMETVRVGREYFPDDVELLYQEGLALRELGDLVGAEDCLLQVLEIKPGQHFASVDTGLRGHKARHNLAVIYVDQKRYRDAEAQWRAALEENPAFIPAIVGLADIFLREHNLAAVSELTGKLQALEPDGIDLQILRARACLVAKEFTEARRILTAIIGRAPNAVYPRVLLSHVWLQEGRDWEAAETALREVLALDPANAEAKCNLGVLLRQQSKQSA